MTRIASKGSVDDIRCTISHINTDKITHAELNAEIEWERMHQNRATVIKMLERLRKKIKGPFQIIDTQRDKVIASNMEASAARERAKTFGFMRERIEKVIKLNNENYGINYNGYRFEKMPDKKEVQS